MWLRANMVALKLTLDFGRPSLSPGYRCFGKERKNPVVATVRRANANLISMAQRKWSQGLTRERDHIRGTGRYVAFVSMSHCLRPMFGDAEPYCCPEK